MVEEWRLIELAVNDAYMNMAIDEAILLTLQEGEAQSTLRLYRWFPSAVSIGYFQSVVEEVDVEACSKLNVDVVRRITGGGAVYHDYEGEITYSLIAKADEPRIPRDILKSYEIICGGIISGLRRLGLSPSFRPVNDILIGGRKVSGNAQTRKRGVVLQHGTILMDVDVEKMFNVLRVSSEKLKDKMIKSVKERVTSIKAELGRKPDFGEVAEALKPGFEEALGVKLVPRALTEKEISLAEKLRKEKYATREWTYKR